jgi:hypothetical protein
MTTRRRKAVSNEDIPNNFVVSYLYELPVGKGKQFLANAPKPVSAVISNWRISGVQRYLGGQPISFFGANGIPGFDNGIRPNRVAGQAVKRSGPFNPFDFMQLPIRAATITLRAPARPAIGTAVLSLIPTPIPASTFLMYSGTCRATRPISAALPSMTRTSASTRPSPSTIAIRADFRGEMFNAFNRHSFNKPDSGVQDDSFGQVTSTLLGPRNVQFTLRITY